MPPSCSCRPDAPGSSLGSGDNDLARLIAHLVAALDSIGLGVDGTLLDSLPTASAAEVLTAIVNHATAAGEEAPHAQWILVLDDYHVIETSDVHDAVSFLLDHLPEHLHLVMATRSDPPLALARLRSRGQLTEVRATDLRFMPAEARELLNRAMGSTSRPPTSTRSGTAPRGGSQVCSSPGSPSERCRTARTSPASSTRSPGATGSSSTTWPTRSWRASLPRGAPSCSSAPVSWTGSPVLSASP